MVKNESVHISHKYSIPLLADSHALLVPAIFWNCMKTRIRQCTESCNRLDSLGWCAIGVGASGLIAALAHAAGIDSFSTVTGQVEHLKWGAILAEILFCFLGLFGIGIGALALYWANDKARMQKDMAEWILEDMRSVEEGHQPPPRPAPAGK
ncbi:MAG: hypothetical protein K8T91_24030 [Planctomycetes bacterium]|nr:hypothetical protein [Planctomycetota bacterium]